MTRYSVNDDLESLFKDLRLRKKPHKQVDTYFFPRLTEEELKLLEKRDTTCQQRRQLIRSLCFRLMWDPDHFRNESDSRFIHGCARRKTYTIANGSLQKISNCCDLQ